MKKNIKTMVDGVPVELQIDDDEVDLSEGVGLETKLRPSHTKVIAIGNAENPVTEEEKTRIQNNIDSTPASLIESLVESLQNVPAKKKWWQSKTIWVNIAAIIASTTALLGLPVHIDPELAMTLYPIILGGVNLLLRRITNKGVEPVVKKKKVGRK